MDERLELPVKLREVRVVLDGMEGCVVPGVALILPNVDERVAVADLGPPATNEVDLCLISRVPATFTRRWGIAYLVLWHACHPRIPAPN